MKLLIDPNLDIGQCKKCGEFFLYLYAQKDAGQVNADKCAECLQDEASHAESVAVWGRPK